MFGRCSGLSPNTQHNFTHTHTEVESTWLLALDSLYHNREGTVALFWVKGTLSLKTVSQSVTQHYQPEQCLVLVTEVKSPFNLLPQQAGSGKYSRTELSVAQETSSFKEKENRPIYKREI